MKRRILLTALVLGLSSSASALERDINTNQLIQILSSATTRIDIYSVYMRAAPIERALMRAATENGINIKITTLYNSLMGPADMFANLIYGGYTSSSKIPDMVTAHVVPSQNSGGLMLIDGKYLITGEFGLNGSRLHISDNKTKINQAAKWFNQVYKTTTPIDASLIYQMQYIQANPEIAKKLDLPSVQKFLKEFGPMKLKTAEEVLKENKPRR